jgi:uncharacterized protein
LEVTFTHLGARLAGTIERPESVEARAAAVFVHGSGPATRDGFAAFAAHLAGAGIASLRYDKPGCGASGGDWTAQTFDDRAAEALTALRTLGDPVPATCRGLIGGSQGGWIAALAASASSDVRFAVCLSPAGVTPAEQEAFRIEHQGAAEGLPRAQIAEALQVFERRLELMRSGVAAEEVFEREADARAQPWFGLVGDETVEELRFDFGIYDFDAAAVLARVRCPVLGVWGERDVIVPVEASVAAYRRAASSAGRDNDEFHVLEGADHGLRRPGSSERVPELFATVIDWIARVCA